MTSGRNPRYLVVLALLLLLLFAGGVAIPIVGLRSANEPVRDDVRQGRADSPSPEPILQPGSDGAARSPVPRVVDSGDVEPRATESPEPESDPRLIIEDHTGTPVAARVYLWMAMNTEHSSIRTVDVPADGVPIAVLDGVDAACGETIGGGIFIIGWAPHAVQECTEAAKPVRATPPGYGYFAPALTAHHANPDFARELQPVMTFHIATHNDEPVEAALTATPAWRHVWVPPAQRAREAPMIRRWHLPEAIEGRLGAFPTPFVVLSPATRPRPPGARRTVYQWVEADTFIEFNARVPSVTVVRTADGLGCSTGGCDGWASTTCNTHELVPSADVSLLLLDQFGAPYAHVWFEVWHFDRLGRFCTDATGRAPIGAVPLDADSLYVEINDTHAEYLGRNVPLTSEDDWIAVDAALRKGQAEELVVRATRLPRIRLTLHDPTGAIGETPPTIEAHPDGEDINDDDGPHIPATRCKWDPDSDGTMTMPVPPVPFHVTIDSFRHGEQVFGPFEPNASRVQDLTIELAVPPVDLVVHVSPTAGVAGATWNLTRRRARYSRRPDGVVGDDGVVELINRIGEWNVRITPAPAVGWAGEPLVAWTEQYIEIRESDQRPVELAIDLQRAAVVVVPPSRWPVLVLALAADGGLRTRYLVTGAAQVVGVPVPPGRVIVRMRHDDDDRGADIVDQVVAAGEVVRLPPVREYRMKGLTHDYWNPVLHQWTGERWTELPTQLDGTSAPEGAWLGPLPPGRYRVRTNTQRGSSRIREQMVFTLPDDADAKNQVVWTPEPVADGDTRRAVRGQRGSVFDGDD